MLSGSAAAANEPYRAALLSPLEVLGYRVGHNLRVDRRSAEGQLDRLPALAAELVTLKPDILFTAGTQAAIAASKATRKIPIVFVAVADPEGLGIVKSLRQPGTNATGFSNLSDEFQIKLLELVKEAFPTASEVTVLHNPANASEVRMLPAFRRAGLDLGLKLRLIEARAAGDLLPAFRQLKTKPSDVLYVLGNPLTFSERHHIVTLANGQRQMTVYGLPEFADAGGLMAHSFSLMEQHSAAAIFVDKILRGASPATLPVEQPTRFELVLNLRTAKAQGVTFPPAMLLRANRLIE
jgi:putative ABC transport system substrate-binding protein